MLLCILFAATVLGLGCRGFEVQMNGRCVQVSPGSTLQFRLAVD